MYACIYLTKNSLLNHRSTCLVNVKCHISSRVQFSNCKALYNNIFSILSEASVSCLNFVCCVLPFLKFLLVLCSTLLTEIHGGYWEVMAGIDCLRRNFTSIFGSDLVANDSAFCCCDAVGNSCPIQHSRRIGHNVLLPQR